jgi:CRISPR-associated protein Csx10
MSESLSLTLRLTFESDWHVGSGLERPGSVDRLVQRDDDGFPFVPAKTLTGILRDAAEQAAAALDEGHGTAWHEWVLWLFGDQPARAEGAKASGSKRPELLAHDGPTCSALSIRPARFPEDLRKAVLAESSEADRDELRESLVFIKPGVMIDRWGRAEDHTLRLDEMALPEVQLTSPVELNEAGLTDAQKAAARNLLVLTASLVERLGGKRRRGAGRVKVTVEGDGIPRQAEAANWLQHNVKPPPIPEPQSHVSRIPGFRPALSDAEWSVLPFRIALRTPVMIAERALGNVVKSLDFIPGTYLLPLLTRSLRASLPVIRAAIGAGDLRISPATLEINGVRGLPVPAALFHAKGVEGLNPDAIPDDLSNALIRQSREHVKDYRSGYLSAEMTEEGRARIPAMASSRKVVRSHNTIDEESQRPSEDVGGVFSYEAIAAGTVLRGEIRIRTSIVRELNQKEPEWWAKLSAAQSLGRSRKDDYGLVDLSVEGPPTPWTPTFDLKCGAVDTATIWLTSDALLPGERLDADPNLEGLLTAIASGLGIPRQSVEVDQIRDREFPRDAVFLRHRRIESWHVGWGLPRPSLIGLTAGSCARVKLTPPVAAESLATLEAEGIGLRRAEGYGTLRINHPLLTQDVTEWIRAIPAENPVAHRNAERVVSRPAALSGASLTIARQMELTCWRRRIRQAALGRMSDDVRREELFGLKPGKPNPAQAALVRNLMRLELKDPSRAVASLKRIDEMRESKWPREALARFIRCLEDRNVVWEALEAGTWPILTINARDSLRRELWPEAVRTLIDAALRAHQRAGEKQLMQESSHGA